MAESDAGGTILYLSRRDVEAACRAIDPVALVSEALALHAAGRSVLPNEAYLAWTNASGESARSLNMPGYLQGPIPVAGTKIINGNPSNVARGIPRASGVMLLFDVSHARIICIMEGAFISALRTASVTAVAADLLTPGPIERLALIGAGALAQAHVELLVERLHSLRSIRIFDIVPERAARLEARNVPALAARGVTIEVAASPEEAIRRADLVVPVTTTTSGYIQLNWLRPGALLVNVSLDDCLPEVLLRADKLFVDDLLLVQGDDRRLLGRLIRQGLVTEPNLPPICIAGSGVSRPIDGQLGEVITGSRPGREAPHEVIIVNPFGLSLEDIAIASAVYRQATKAYLGIHLEL